MSAWLPIVYLVLVVLGLGIDMGRHGRMKTGEHNAWISLFAAVILLAILWSGGFFAPLRAPGPFAKAEPCGLHARKTTGGWTVLEPNE